MRVFEEIIKVYKFRKMPKFADDSNLFETLSPFSKYLYENYRAGKMPAVPSRLISISFDPLKKVMAKNGNYRNIEFILLKSASVRMKHQSFSEDEEESGQGSRDLHHLEQYSLQKFRLKCGNCRQFLNFFREKNCSGLHFTVWYFE